MRKRQASWIMPRRTRAISRFGETFLMSPGTAFIGRTGETVIARDNSSVTQAAREHFPHEHVLGFNADPDDAGHQPEINTACARLPDEGAPTAMCRHSE